MIFIVDEIDVFVGSERLRFFHRATDGPEGNTTQVVDILELLARAKFVAGFCSVVEESTSRLIAAKMQHMRQEDVRTMATGSQEVPKNREIWEFNYGNFKGTGDAPYSPPTFEIRSGFTTDNMWADTLNKLRDVLSEEKSP
jgi:hypothetical protein